MKLEEAVLELPYTCNNCGKAFNVAVLETVDNVMCPHCGHLMPLTEEQRQSVQAAKMLEIQRQWLDKGQ